MSSTRHRPLLAAATILLAAAGPAAAAAPAAATPRVTPAISWQSCGSTGSQCGTIAVPLDWSQPAGPAVTVALTRHPATGSSLGTLVFLPGGGYTALDIVAGSATEYFGSLGAGDLADRYDLIGVEQRGGGTSLFNAPITLPARTAPQLTCPAPVHDQAVSAFPASPAQFDALVAHNRAFAQSCRTATGPLADHVDSVSQARDLEAIRGALGVPQLNLLSWQYADVTAQAYTDLFPQRVRKVTLDGPVSGVVPATATAVQEAQAVNAAWNEFVTWCAANPLSTDYLNGCALHGQPVDQLYQQTLADATATPMLSARLGRTFNGEEIAFLVQQRLEQGSPNVLGLITNGWTQLSLSLLETSTTRTANGFSYMYERSWGLGSVWNNYRVTACLDSPDRLAAYGQAKAQITAIRAVAPKTRGVSEAWDVRSGCAGWPAAAVPPPTSFAPVTGPSVLVISSRYNAFAPRSHASLVAAHFRNSSVADSRTVSGIAFFIPELTGRTVQHFTGSSR